ncbi:hypothetical protein [Enterococcus hirae]|uniref:hypothetical protein n=1 Tax=Enterococcus hirae TaxID=1354 RepID=UPI00136FEE87|nr:hypothetical protein [Enterococcus hirae]NAE18032.1 hypothetical protein [Enterococcus hirae]
MAKYKVETTGGSVLEIEALDVFQDEGSLFLTDGQDVKAVFRKDTWVVVQMIDEP